jgi:superfamily II DNA or RNA helicase
VPTLRFEDGTVTIEGLGDAAVRFSDICTWDQRIGRHRARARSYAEIVRRLHGVVAYDDQARRYRTLAVSEHMPRPLREYQQRSLDAWLANQKCGVVVLPTGAGKTYVALKAILACQRSTLVLAPTIDLVQQWATDLEQRLGCPIGQYGGGEKVLCDITVATYDSAVLIMPWHGDKFGLLICDECHHLPAEITRGAAEQCIAPFRLGLTATPERSDGAHNDLTQLLGAEVHRSHISELEGSFLANYQVETIEVPLATDEQQAYDAARKHYIAFVRRMGIDFGQKDGWARFIAACGRDGDGRSAMRA